jgi:hypothetical protein
MFMCITADTVLISSVTTCLEVSFVFGFGYTPVYLEDAGTG